MLVAVPEVFETADGGERTILVDARLQQALEVIDANKP